jgi:mycofactocin precursor
VLAMTTSESTDLDTAAPDSDSAEPSDAVLIEDELIIEEISIDGMCGVY